MNEKSSILSAEEFSELFQQCRRSRGVAEGDLGVAASCVSAERVVRASRLVTTGATISCARPIQTKASADNPRPAVHLMTELPAGAATAEGAGVAADYLALECHGDAQSHIDALCHIAWAGRIFSGEDASVTVPLSGAVRGGLELAVDGLVSRGVLLDVPVLEGIEWLEPGQQVALDQLQRAESRLTEPIGAGDIVLVRTGHDRRRRVLGAWPTAQLKAGLDVRAMPWFGAKGIVALGFDGDGDVIPHLVSGVTYPIHVLGIVAMGLYFLDSLDLERLSEHCAHEGRWEFLCTVAPLHLVGGTGAPINPIAIF